MKRQPQTRQTAPMQRPGKGPDHPRPSRSQIPASASRRGVRRSRRDHRHAATRTQLFPAGRPGDRVMNATQSTIAYGTRRTGLPRAREDEAGE
jgi:hypothetical protein